MLRRNEFGGSARRPLHRDRAFFFVNYDGMRRTQETSQTVTVPTAALRDGVFRFATQPCAGETIVRNRPSCVGLDGSPLVPVSSYSFVANDPRQLGVDPVLRQETLAFLPLPTTKASVTGSTPLDTGGTRRRNRPSTASPRASSTLNQRQSLFGRYTNAWRNDLINDIINATPRPLSWPARVRLSDQQGAAIGHKWTITNYLLNEVTGGFTRNVLDFADPEHPRTYRSAVPAACSRPVRLLAGTGREPTEFQFIDNVSWVRGAHAFRGGANVRLYYIKQTRGAGTPFGIYPSFTFSRLDAPFSGNETSACPARWIAGQPRVVGHQRHRSQQSQHAVNVLLGRIGRIDQGFYSNGSEFVALEPLKLDQRMQEYNYYVQDDWRIRRTSR